jgi:hypothetical protein
MPIVVDSQSYVRDVATSANSVPYIGPANTVSTVDQLAMSRIAPKPTSTFSGVSRCEGKLTRTCVLTNAKTPTWEAIGKSNITFPVGMSGADQDEFLDDFALFVASAEFKALAKTHAFAA